jgi:hypothetical protein
VPALIAGEANPIVDEAGLIAGRTDLIKGSAGLIKGSAAQQPRHDCVHPDLLLAGVVAFLSGPVRLTSAFSSRWFAVIISLFGGRRYLGSQLAVSS